MDRDAASPDATGRNRPTLKSKAAGVLGALAVAALLVHLLSGPVEDGPEWECITGGSATCAEVAP